MVGVCYHHHLDELLNAFRDSLKDGDALGAHREAIAGILDVAAGEYTTVFGQNRRPDLKMGIGRMSPLPRLSGHFNQFFIRYLHFSTLRSLLQTGAGQLRFDFLYDRINARQIGAPFRDDNVSVPLAWLDKL